ncbi:unnamed protein product [Dovyalis caffra]|uniref:Uncharacterized protein n=1 Tax=Dovyalis caffra TaxID=77055 RepID=A0AAV1RIK3_9ROSI|nr:unnamed protein product [Dovyalis caffra]
MWKGRSIGNFDCKYLTRTGVEQSSNVEEFGHMASVTIDARNLSGDGSNGLKRHILIHQQSETGFLLLQVEVSVCIQVLDLMLKGSASAVVQDLQVEMIAVRQIKVARVRVNPAWEEHNKMHGKVPQIGCNLVMQCFSAPPIFDVRNSVRSQQYGVLYSIPNIGRFSSHRQPYGFHNPFDGLQTSLLLGAIRSESHIWETRLGLYDRILISGIESETDAVMFTGQSYNVRMELPSTVQNEYNSVHAPPDEEATHDLSKMLTVHDARYRKVYFSKIDVSADFTDPQLYDQCLTLMDMEPNKLPMKIPLRL